MNAEAFENVKNQIGFCGIWCGSCVVGNGALRELTKRYEEVIKGYGVKEWGPKDFDFEEFMKGLASIQAMPLCQGCLKGDGRPNCEMRICASNKKINDCSECDQPEDCKNAENLEKMRTGALSAGLLVKTEDIDREKLIEKWTAELKNMWPSSILFLPDE
jgi:flavodoxin